MCHQTGTQCSLGEFHTKDIPCPLCSFDEVTAGDFPWTDLDNEVFYLLNHNFIMSDYHKYMRLHPGLHIDYIETESWSAKENMVHIDPDRLEEANLCWPVILSTFGDNNVVMIVDGWHRVMKARTLNIKRLPAIFIQAEKIHRMRQSETAAYIQKVEEATQRDTRSMTNSHVLACQTLVVDTLAQSGDLCGADFHNYYISQLAGQIEDPAEMEALLMENFAHDSDWEEVTGSPFNADDPDIEHHMAVVHDWLVDHENDYEPEIHMWFLISKDLAEALQERGYITLEYGNNYWWGRQAGGQAVYMDAIMIEIAKHWGLIRYED